MADEIGYNGWSNYPTWAVNLWLSNDEALYREALRRVEVITDGLSRDQYESERVYGRVADDFKSWVEDDLSPDLGASFAADLYGFALGEVDWHEIAGAWVDE